MHPAIRTLGAMSARGRVTLAASAVATLVVAVVMFQLVSRPSYATVLAGIEPASSSKVTAALEKKGIAYELRSNGTAVAVPSDQTAQARIALAEQGLPGDGQPGFELFDKHDLSTS